MRLHRWPRTQTSRLSRLKGQLEKSSLMTAMAHGSEGELSFAVVIDCVLLFANCIHSALRADTHWLRPFIAVVFIFSCQNAFMHSFLTNWAKVTSLIITLVTSVISEINQNNERKSQNLLNRINWQRSKVKESNRLSKKKKLLRS